MYAIISAHIHTYRPISQLIRAANKRYAIRIGKSKDLIGSNVKWERFYINNAHHKIHSQWQKLKRLHFYHYTFKWHANMFFFYWKSKRQFLARGQKKMVEPLKSNWFPTSVKCYAIGGWEKKGKKRGNSKSNVNIKRFIFHFNIWI